MADDPEHATEFLEPPDVLGVEQLTVDGAVIRTIAKTTADGQFAVQRELRRRLTEALETSGISERIAASRMLPRPADAVRERRPRPADRPDRSHLTCATAVRGMSVLQSEWPTIWPYALASGRTIGQNPAQSICTCSVTFAAHVARPADVSGRPPRPGGRRERWRAWCPTTDPSHARPTRPTA